MLYSVYFYNLPLLIRSAILISKKVTKAQSCNLSPKRNLFSLKYIRLCKHKKNTHRIKAFRTRLYITIESTVL